MTAIDTYDDLDVAPPLPPIAADLEEAKAHLDEWGVARLADAMTPAEVTALNERLREQAAAERELGVAFRDNGANQRVWNLPNKGRVFLDLLRKPLVRTLARHVLGGDYLLSSHSANITGPGGTAQGLHTDQGYAPRSIELPLAVNFMWCLVDFTDEIGGTRLRPGSHLTTAEPPRDPVPATVAGVGPAGSVIVFDGRIWHGTGANTTADQYRYGVLTYFVRPWMRQQENFALSVDPAVVADADDDLLNMLGLRTWRTLGGVEGPWGPGTPDAATYASSVRIAQHNDLIGELRPG